jgi:tRNA 2-thiouridine synthesizing protein B
MATLHIVNKPATHDALARCMSLASPGDAVLLIEDGVYCALPRVLSTSATERLNLFALRTDAQARGLQTRLAAHVTMISDREFVELVVKHQPIVTWSST